MASGINVAWLADFDSRGQSVMDRVWDSLRADDEWKAWLGAHTAAQKPTVVINFEDRPAPRLVLRGTKITYYVPMGYVTAAREARNLKSFAADLFREVYVKWADKKGLPEPPAITPDRLDAVPSRFP